MTDSDISDIFSTPATTPPATREQEVFFDFGEFDFLSASHFPELPWAQFEESGFPSAMILDSTDDPETTIPVPKCKKVVQTGNNRYGKKGKLRCEQCRSWRQKCEYDTVGSRCTYCQSKNLDCGPKVSANGWRTQQLVSKTQKSTVLKPEKIAITRLIKRSPEDKLNPCEERHMKSIHKGDFLFTFALLQVSRTDGHRLSDCLFRRFGLYLSSKPIRYSCIVYSSFKAGEITNDTLHAQYLDGFYKTMQKAIEQKAFADVAYGCFIACMYGLKVRRPFEEIANHAKGFRLAVYQIHRTVVDEETFLLECMWEKLLWHMGRQLFFHATPTLECLNQLAEFAYPLGLSDYKSMDVWIQDSFHELELKLLFMRLVISLDLQGTVESRQLKTAIVKRFWRDWTIESPLGSFGNRSQIRRISRKLWSGILVLLWDLTHLPFISPVSLNTMISCFHSTVDSLHEHVDIGQSPLEVREVIELAWNGLTLIGLVICDVQPTHTLGTIMLLTPLIVAFYSTRAHLLNLSHGLATVKHLLSSFDEACLDIVSETREWDKPRDPSRAISIWVGICA